MHEKEPDLTKKHLIWRKGTWTKQKICEWKNLRSVRLELSFDIQSNLEVVWLSLLLLSNIFILTITYYGSHTPLFSAAVSRIKKFIMMSLGFACFFWPEYHNNRNILHNAKTSRWIWLLLLNNKQSPQTNIIWCCKQFQYVYYMVRTLDHFG